MTEHAEMSQRRYFAPPLTNHPLKGLRYQNEVAPVLRMHQTVRVLFETIGERKNRLNLAKLRLVDQATPSWLKPWWWQWLAVRRAGTLRHQPIEFKPSLAKLGKIPLDTNAGQDYH